VFLDAIHYKVREDGRVVTKAAYMGVGIDLAGYQDVLGMGIGAHESATGWLTVLSELTSRGVQDVLVVAGDHLTGFREAIATVFPRADIPKCLVHQIRHALQYAARKDYAALATALRPLYQAPTEAAGAAALEAFTATWGPKYPAVVRSWQAHWPELATFFRYPPALRRVIYTTTSLKASTGSCAR